MQIGNLDKAAALAREADWLARDITAYRKAGSIGVSIKATVTDSRGSPRYESNHGRELSAAEIRDAIVEALSRRLEAMHSQLRGLGVEAPEPAIAPVAPR